MKTSFTFFTMLTFVLRVQKQWWLKPLAPQPESGQCYQAVLVVIVFSTTVHTHCKEKKMQSLNVLEEAVKIILLK